MTICDELRQAVLQAAIQGKLTEQREEDGTAEELLEEIRKEKERLIREGKIKKEKKLLEIDEVPFEIPENWKWVRLGYLCSVVTGSLDANAQNENGKYAFFTCGVEVYKTLEYAFDCDAILLGGNNASGDYKMHRYCGKFNAYQRVYVISDPPKVVLDFIYLVITYWLPFLKQNSQGTTTRFIKLSQVNSMSIPLPPLAEQHRIVERVNILMKKIDALQTIEDELQSLKQAFPSNMRDAILQAAMQGKLTEQLESDGIAEELLEEIKKEKEKLIKEGKIKKEKKLPEISEDEIPFDIPENWKWVRCQDVFYKITDGTHKTPHYTMKGVYFLSVKDLSTGNISFDNTKYISHEEHDELYKRCDPEKGDILITKVGTTGIPVLVDTNEPFSLFVSVALLKFTHHLLDVKYLLNAIKSPVVQEQVRNNTRGVGNKNWVLDAVKSTIFPLPPLAEQHRIVARLNELLPLCDTLKEAK